MSRGNALIALLALLLSGGCYQKMSQQPKYDPLEPSAFWADGMSARPRLPGTVARGELHVSPYFATGMIDGQHGDGLPFPITEAVMERGEERYNIYCSQCHGRTGDGNGMIPARGFSRARSFHTEPMRTAKAGHFFDVITNGFGAMPPHRNIVPPEDRWAIIAYIRALQLSQHATMAEVPPDQRNFGARATSPAPASGGGH